MLIGVNDGEIVEIVTTWVHDSRSRLFCYRVNILHALGIINLTKIPKSVPFQLVVSDPLSISHYS